MTYYSDNGKPLSKKLEKQINEHILMKNVNDFVAYLQEKHKGEKLTSDKILKLFLSFNKDFSASANILIRRLRETGKFPYAKAFKIGKKTVHLYHIR